MLVYAEREQLAENVERMHHAVGTAYAIAQALGSKKAMKQYAKQLDRSRGGSGARAGDSDAMAEVRRRLRAAGVMGA